MRFRYSTRDPAQLESDSLPWLPLMLRVDTRGVEAIGLVDSGATVNVLPFDLGVELGAVWDDRRAILRVSGGMGNQQAIPIFAVGEIDGPPAAKLAFAWIKQSSAPLIFGQSNFFMEYDVCFFRSQLEFEIRPKSPVTVPPVGASAV